MFLRSIMIVHQRGQRSLFKLTTAKPLGPGSGQLKAGFIGRKIADDRRSSKSWASLPPPYGTSTYKSFHL